MADEGGMQNFHVSKDEDTINHPKSILFKAAQVILTLIILGLIIYPLDSFYHKFTTNPRLTLFDAAMIYSVLCGYLIINCVLILGFLMGDRMPRITSLLFSTLGTILHLITAIIMTSNWRKLSSNYPFVMNNHTYPSQVWLWMFTTGSIITFFESIVFGVEVFFIIRYF